MILYESTLLLRGNTPTLCQMWQLPQYAPNEEREGSPSKTKTEDDSFLFFFTPLLHGAVLDDDLLEGKGDVPLDPLADATLTQPLLHRHHRQQQTRRVPRGVSARGVVAT